MQPDIDAFEMGIQIRRGPWPRLGDRHATRGGQPSGGGQPEDPATDARGQAIVVGAQDDGPHRQFGWHLETIAAPPPPDECADGPVAPEYSDDSCDEAVVMLNVYPMQQGMRAGTSAV